MGVIIGILVMVVLFFVLYLIGLVIEPLLALLSQSARDILLVIGFVAFIIAANVYYYHRAYVSGRGKKWHFWLSFGTTVMFILVFISTATQ